jgi:hypothetical protein
MSCPFARAQALRIDSINRAQVASSMIPIASSSSSVLRASVNVTPRAFVSMTRRHRGQTGTSASRPQVGQMAG